jgi:hypothetical protein
MTMPHKLAWGTWPRGKVHLVLQPRNERKAM